jgi:hypothetical protein
VFRDCLIIKRRRLALDDRDCAAGAIAQARAQAVAVDVRDKFRFAVHNSNRPLGTGRNALAAAVTLVFVNVDDFSLGCRNHRWTSSVVLACRPAMAPRD